MRTLSTVDPTAAVACTQPITEADDRLKQPGHHRAARGRADLGRHRRDDACRQPRTNGDRFGLRIGDVAREAGLTIQTLRYYERRGLVVAG